MTAVELLAELDAAGIAVVCEGDNLRVRGRSGAVALFTDRIREHKPALLAVLAAVDEADAPNGDDWYTPAEYIEPARALMEGIDLDPASCAVANATVRAARIYTKADDGLRLPWHGRVWLNPPYSKVADFAAKLEAEFDAGRVTSAVLLCHARPDSAWFRRLAGRFPFLCTTRRVKFWHPAKPKGGHHVIGQALFGVGVDPAAFARAYAGLAYAPNRGVCWQVGDANARGARSGVDWRHVAQGPVVATQPPAAWNGALCPDCRWEPCCRVLGPRGPQLAGGPCPAWPGETQETT